MSRPRKEQRKHSPQREWQVLSPDVGTALARRRTRGVGDGEAGEEPAGTGWGGSGRGQPKDFIFCPKPGGRCGMPVFLASFPELVVSSLSDSTLSDVMLIA